MRSALTIILAMFVLFSIVGCATAPEESGTIRIGYVGSLSGDYASYGEDEVRTVKLAIEEINAQGGIDGQPLEVIYEDGACAGPESVSAAQKLITVDKVKFILGGACSTETLAMAPVTEAAGVLVFTSTSTSPDVTTAGDLVFRNSPSDLAGATATAQLAYGNGARRVAIIAENKDFPLGFKRIFSEEFVRLGGTVSSDQQYDSDEADMRTMVTKAIADDPDAILIASMGPSGGRVAKQLDEAGWDGQLYGNVIMGGQEILDEYGASVEGLYYADTAGLDPTVNSRAAAYLQAFESKYGKKPLYDFYQGARYDSVFILAEALRAVGDDPMKVRDYLYGMPPYDGVIGTYNFDGNGDPVGLSYKTYQIEDGKVVET